MALRCPRCGGPVVHTAQGIVCAKCGLVISDTIIDDAPYWHRRDDKPKRIPRGSRILKLRAKPSISAVLAGAPEQDIDPLDRRAYDLLRSKKEFSLGRKPRTLAALARVARLLAMGAPLLRAVEEASTRYNVSKKTLLTLARRHRALLMEASARVVEAWHKSNAKR
ncbi:MAG: TFIIB-type zinc ribbon-containing protein [Desulfurococcales archaeon]|nr:TFIIB-type zinc ribbon-containing protein [Desulfurococcales archaeon]